MILSVGLKSNFLKVLLWGLEQDTAYSQTLHGRIRGIDVQWSSKSGCQRERGTAADNRDLSSILSPT